MAINQNTLKELISKQIVLINELLDLLDHEQHSLIKHNLESLQTLTESKTPLVNQLNHYHQHYLSLLSSNNLNPSDTIAKLADRELENLWIQLLESSAKAKETNRINGLLIHRLLNQNQQKQSILHNNEKNLPALYGPDGQNTQPLLTRSFIG